MREIDVHSKYPFATHVYLTRFYEAAVGESYVDNVWREECDWYWIWYVYYVFYYEDEYIIVIIVFIVKFYAHQLIRDAWKKLQDENYGVKTRLICGFEALVTSVLEMDADQLNALRAYYVEYNKKLSNTARDTLNAIVVTDENLWNSRFVLMYELMKGQGFGCFVPKFVENEGVVKCCWGKERIQAWGKVLKRQFGLIYHPSPRNEHAQDDRFSLVLMISIVHMMANEDKDFPDALEFTLEKQGQEILDKVRQLEVQFRDLKNHQRQLKLKDCVLQSRAKIFGGVTKPELRQERNKTHFEKLEAKYNTGETLSPSELSCYSRCMWRRLLISCEESPFEYEKW